jgi:hypothetical protein
MKKLIIIGLLAFFGYSAQAQTRVEITNVGTVSKTMAASTVDTTVTSVFPIDGTDLSFIVEGSDSLSCVVKIAYVSPAGLTENVTLASRPTVATYPDLQRVEYGAAVTKEVSQWMAKLYIITTNTKTVSTNAVTVKVYRVRKKL